MEEKEEIIIQEGTGHAMFPKSCLEKKLSQDTFLEDAKTYAKKRKISDRSLENFWNEINKFHSFMDNTTELWEYDELGPLCGSAGLALIRKETGELITGYVMRRA